MSYRIMINDEQLFGNNEYPDAFLTFLKESGVKVSKSGCFEHTFPTGSFDVMKAVAAIEEYVHHERKQYRKRHPNKYFFDFSDYEKSMEEESENGFEPEPLLDWTMQQFNCGFMLLPLFFIETLLGMECIKPCRCYSDGVHLHCYEQIKEITICGS